MDVAAVVADETLEDGAVLGVDRQELDATPSGGRRHQVPGHHQRLLVGERHGAPGQDPRHRRQEPGGTHERRHDDVGLDVPGERGQTRQQYALSAEGRRHLFERLSDFSESDAASEEAFNLRVGLFPALKPDVREKILALRDSSLRRTRTASSLKLKRTSVR